MTKAHRISTALLRGICTDSEGGGHALRSIYEYVITFESNMVFSICCTYECYRSGFDTLHHFIQGDIIQSWGTSCGKDSLPITVRGDCFQRGTLICMTAHAHALLL